MYRRRRRRPRYRFRQGGQRRLALVISVTVIAVSAAAGFAAAWREGLFPVSAGAQSTASVRPVAEFLPDATVGASMAPSRLPEASPSGTAAPASTEPSAAASIPVGSGSEGMAFVGNSGISDLYVSGFLPDADYYYKVGLNVRSASDTAMDNGTVPVIDELSDHDYSEIFLLFGQNELGWPAPEVFFEEYAGLIQKAHEYCPNATVYIMSILPMSEEASDRNDNGENQQRADQYNEQLVELAKENDAYFLDFTTDLKGSDGYLPADAAADGVHLNQTYLGRWADMIKDRGSYIENAG